MKCDTMLRSKKSGGEIISHVSFLRKLINYAPITVTLKSNQLFTVCDFYPPPQEIEGEGRGLEYENTQVEGITKVLPNYQIFTSYFFFK